MEPRSGDMQPPAADELVNPAAGFSRSRGTDLFEIPASRRRRILVADADTEFTSSVETLLRGLGCEVIIAKDLGTFQRVNAEMEPDVILLNIQFGEHSVLEVFRHLSEARCRTGIVVMGDADVKVLESTVRLGRDRRLNMGSPLTRPIAASALRDALKDTILLQPKITREEVIEAIEARRFIPFFQPVVNLKGGTKAVIRSEVLARWDHPLYGILPASDFIGVVEEHGLAARLTTSVLSQALEYISICREAGLILPISVNVSAAGLTDLSLPQELTEIVSGYGFENDVVTIELSESAVTEDVAESLEVLTGLRLRGFELSMDDFGTGFATLRELVRLPFNEIKIDVGFARERQHESETIIGSTVVLAHGLGMTVCAEGVESRASLEFLRTAGCDAAQGRFIQAPVAGEDLMDSLSLWRGSAKEADTPGLVESTGGNKSQWSNNDEESVIEEIS